METHGPLKVIDVIVDRNSLSQAWDGKNFSVILDSPMHAQVFGHLMSIGAMPITSKEGSAENPKSSNNATMALLPSAVYSMRYVAPLILNGVFKASIELVSKKVQLESKARIPTLQIETNGASLAAGDKLAKELYESLQMHELSKKRVKLSGDLVNGFLSVAQEKEVQAAMVMPWLQEVANRFEASSANELKSLKQELLLSKESEANTAREMMSMKERMGKTESALKDLMERSSAAESDGPRGSKKKKGGDGVSDAMDTLG